MSVDPAIVEWLKTGIYYAGSADDALTARWGGLAKIVTVNSPLAFKAEADAESARQLAIFSGPTAIDAHIVPGDRTDLKFRCITLAADQLGYDQGVPAFVIGADNTKGDTTTLTVVRRL